MGSSVLGALHLARTRSALESTFYLPPNAERKGKTDSVSAGSVILVGEGLRSTPDVLREMHSTDVHVCGELSVLDYACGLAWPKTCPGS